MSREIKLSPMSKADSYLCQRDWPEDCDVQAGDGGIVFTGKTIQDAFESPVETVEMVLDKTTTATGIYRTAFFEAFPRSPDTFIRGEGETVEAAETAAWEKLQAQAVCSHSEFEKKGYTNGAGFCVDCNLFAPKHFAPWDECRLCKYPIYTSDDMLCDHCDLVFNKPENPEEGSTIDFWIWERYMAAQWLVRQLYVCPCCHLELKMMRFVPAGDHRLTPVQLARQDSLHHRTIDVARNRPYGSILKTNRYITFSSSVWFECWCDDLKLITDLVSVGPINYNEWELLSKDVTDE